MTSVCGVNTSHAKMTLASFFFFLTFLSLYNLFCFYFFSLTRWRRESEACSWLPSPATPMSSRTCGSWTPTTKSTAERGGFRCRSPEWPAPLAPIPSNQLSTHSTESSAPLSRCFRTKPTSFSIRLCSRFVSLVLIFFCIVYCFGKLNLLEVLAD